MTKHIGIVACSAEGAALCYRTICKEAPALMGEHMHPEVSMHTHPLGEYMVHIRSGNWAEVAKLMLSSAKKLATIGAQFAICPDNTIHEAFDYVVEKSPIPWLHIAEEVAKKAGLSTRTFERGKKIVEEGTEEEKQLLREGKASIAQVYREVVAPQKETLELGKPLPDPKIALNKARIEALLKSLSEHQLFCPECGNAMFECSKCHKTLRELLGDKS